ncbi:MAG TPA: DUF5985 family protein [Steroidobacteraceae bacterium]|jgi:peptidoglycan/LPS O-acetylase OafA/YrhL|nr:DUF5985 family protein [Steroidobacteraceae bacterium]
MREFIWGMLTTTHLLAALFFLRSWRTSGDRFFAYFAAAFAAMAAEWLALAVTPQAQPARYYLYVVRLLAFLLIIVGIIEKNRGARRI